jgi:hypothetical protein
MLSGRDPSACSSGKSLGGFAQLMSKRNRLFVLVQSLLWLIFTVYIRNTLAGGDLLPSFKKKK